MSFSQGTACHLVPLLARIVLAAAFIPAGWNKLTGTASFAPADAAILRELGVKVQEFPVAMLGEHGIHRVRFAHAASRPPAVRGPGPDDPEAAVDDRPEGDAESTPPLVQDRKDPSGSEVGATTAPPPGGPLPSSPVAGDDSVGDIALTGGTAGSLHRITLLVHAQGWPAPVLQAWMAVAVELLGGALILVGLFSRLWGLGLAAIMGVAFWMTTWPVLQETSIFALAIPDFTRFCAQAALFVLAFGVALTGPGAASIDRLLFPRTGAEEEAPA